MVYHAYILTNQANSVLYVGVTNDIARRIYEHRHKLIKGFSSKYNANKLVYCETYDDIEDAIRREKQLKNWRRSWKIKLIEESNENWDDLYELGAW